MPETVVSIFNYLIVFWRATYCVVYGSEQNSRNRNDNSDGFNMGWLTYFSNKKLQIAISGDPRAAKYQNGTLLRFGGDVSSFANKHIDEEIYRVRTKLLSAGVSDWTRL